MDIIFVDLPRPGRVSLFGGVQLPLNWFMLKIRGYGLQGAVFKLVLKKGFVPTSETLPQALKQ